MDEILVEIKEEIKKINRMESSVQSVQRVKQINNEVEILESKVEVISRELQ